MKCEITCLVEEMDDVERGSPAGLINALVHEGLRKLVSDIFAVAYIEWEINLSRKETCRILFTTSQKQVYCRELNFHKDSSLDFKESYCISVKPLIVVRVFLLQWWLKKIS